MAFKIYTKTGDKGETSLFGGKRLPKHHIRIDAYGTVDEANSFLGLLRDHVPAEEQEVRDLLKTIQDRMFVVGSILACDPEKPMAVPGLEEVDVAQLEEAMDAMESHLEPLKQFILPGGAPAVSYAHVVRSVSRRAERQVVALAETDEVPEILIRYLNRLSDYSFMLARYLAFKLGVEEVKWTARK